MHLPSVQPYARCNQFGPRATTLRALTHTQVPDTKDIEEFESMVMEGCDANGDGKINKKELTTVLMALAKHASDEEQKQQQKL